MVSQRAELLLSAEEPDQVGLDPRRDVISLKQVPELDALSRCSLRPLLPQRRRFSLLFFLLLAPLGGWAPPEGGERVGKGCAECPHLTQAGFGRT